MGTFLSHQLVGRERMTTRSVRALRHTTVSIHDSATRSGYVSKPFLQIIVKILLKHPDKHQKSRANGTPSNGMSGSFPWSRAGLPTWLGILYLLPLLCCPRMLDFWSTSLPKTATSRSGIAFFLSSKLIAEYAADVTEACGPMVTCKNVNNNLKTWYTYHFFIVKWMFAILFHN